MVPLLVLALVAVVLVVAVLGVASGRITVDPLADPVHSTPDHGLPPAPNADDVERVRFDTALRGYRMDEVDARLDDLRHDLATRERVLAELRHPAPGHPEPGHPEPGHLEPGHPERLQGG